MEVLRIILIVLEVLASIALTAVVLLQSGKEAGLSGAIAGGNTDTYLGKNSRPPAHFVRSELAADQGREWQGG